MTACRRTLATLGVALGAALIAGAGALPPTASAAKRPTARDATTSASLTVTSTTVGPPVAAGFVGLATEYWNIEAEVGTDPARPDRAFEQLVRNLAPYGGLTLRIGGDSTDWTWWPIAGIKQPPWVRWTMTPAWAAVTRRLVDDLHAHLIIGINMEADSVRVAHAEVHAIRSHIGGSLPITYEIGNEPELYSHFPYYHDKAGNVVLGRSKSFSLTDMTTQWNHLADALPGVPLAGPGYTSLNALPDVGQFLTESRRLKLLTVHTYPLKSTRCTGGTPLKEDELFAPPALQGLAGGIASWTSLAQRAGVGVRVDEMNSVTCGGSPDFSPTFGPALWALNILPLYAAAGVAGVNFQTRPFTAQNLIQTTHAGKGWRVAVQPEYYGLLAFTRLTPPGSRILHVSSMPSGLLAWAVRTPRGQTHVVITNVNAAPGNVAIHTTGATGAATQELLHAGAGGLWASGGVRLAGQAISPTTGALTGKLATTTVHPSHGAYTVTIPALSAAIVTFR